MSTFPLNVLSGKRELRCYSRKTALSISSESASRSSAPRCHEFTTSKWLRKHLHHSKVKLIQESGSLHSLPSSTKQLSVCILFLQCYLIFDSSSNRAMHDVTFHVWFSFSLSSSHLFFFKKKKNVLEIYFNTRKFAYNKMQILNINIDPEEFPSMSQPPL